MKTCERCGGTGIAPLSSSSGIGVWCYACNGRGEIGGDETKGGETMNDQLTPCPRCGGTNRRATVGDRLRLVDVWCPDCKQLTDYGPIEGVVVELEQLRAERDELNRLGEWLRSVGSTCEIVADQWVQCNLDCISGTYVGTGNTIVEAISDALAASNAPKQEPQP